jgi:hypothetical protein
MSATADKKTPGETLVRALELGKPEGVVPSDIHIELSATGGTVTRKEPEPTEAEVEAATQG